MSATVVSPHKVGLVLATSSAGGTSCGHSSCFLGGRSHSSTSSSGCTSSRRPCQVAAFVPWRAMVLAAMTTTVGYVLGRALGAIRNWVYEP
jgi:hypothetical protein